MLDLSDIVRSFAEYAEALEEFVDKTSNDFGPYDSDLI